MEEELIVDIKSRYHVITLTDPSKLVKCDNLEKTRIMLAPKFNWRWIECPLLTQSRHSEYVRTNKEISGLYLPIAIVPVL